MISGVRGFTKRADQGASVLGGVPCKSIAEVVQKSDIIFSSLSDDAALESIANEMIATGSLKDKIIVDTTTVHPDTSVGAFIRLTKAGALFVAAPVFGASPVAEARQLLFIVARSSAATKAVEPYLKGVMGRAVISVGEDVSKSSLMKTSGNFITTAMMEIIAEAHVFAEKTGLGNEALEGLIEQQYGPLAHTMSKRLTQGAYAPLKGKPWSDLNLDIKDVGHGIKCTKTAGARLKTGEVVMEHLEEAKKFSDSQGQRPLDSSSLYGIIKRDAGLDFGSAFVKQRDNKLAE
ncbi:NAD binding domain of 6-phosphogluconate dehydrogenase [Acephala macrosclerotiorum]|nr:NAD binding domain of 6-phosphogluconate dehydrogenase [Acephala macrosclerotiorum]